MQSLANEYGENGFLIYKFVGCEKIIPELVFCNRLRTTSL